MTIHFFFHETEKWGIEFRLHDESRQKKNVMTFNKFLAEFKDKIFS